MGGEKQTFELHLNTFGIYFPLIYTFNFRLVSPLFLRSGLGNTVSRSHLAAQPGNVCESSRAEETCAQEAQFRNVKMVMDKVETVYLSRTGVLCKVIVVERENTRN